MCIKISNIKYYHHCCVFAPYIPGIILPIRAVVTFKRALKPMLDMDLIDKSFHYRKLFSEFITSAVIMMIDKNDKLVGIQTRSIIIWRPRDAT